MVAFILSGYVILWKLGCVAMQPDECFVANAVQFRIGSLSFRDTAVKCMAERDSSSSVGRILRGAFAAEVQSLTKVQGAETL